MAGLGCKLIGCKAYDIINGTCKYRGGCENTVVVEIIDNITAERDRYKGDMERLQEEKYQAYTDYLELSKKYDKEKQCGTAAARALRVAAEIIKILAIKNPVQFDCSEIEAIKQEYKDAIENYKMCSDIKEG